MVAIHIFQMVICILIGTVLYVDKYTDKDIIVVLKSQPRWVLLVAQVWCLPVTGAQAYKYWLLNKIKEVI